MWSDEYQCSGWIVLSSSQIMDLVFLSSFIFIFFAVYFPIFLFLEQLGLIGHAVTTVTWQQSHKTDHKTGENLVEDLRIDDVIQHGYHMLASWTTHGCLG